MESCSDATSGAMPECKGKGASLEHTYQKEKVGRMSIVSMSTLWLGNTEILILIIFESCRTWFQSSLSVAPWRPVTLMQKQLPDCPDLCQILHPNEEVSSSNLFGQFLSCFSRYFRLIEVSRGSNQGHDTSFPFRHEACNNHECTLRKTLMQRNQIGYSRTL